MRDARTQIERRQARHRENIPMHLHAGAGAGSWLPHAHRTRRTPVPLSPQPSAPRSMESAAGAEPMLAEHALAVLDHPQAIPETQRGSVHPHILIVEDDARAARAIREMLELEGDPAWNIQVASDGQHALDLASASPPGVVLLDVMLPGLDGAEVYRRLRANPLTRSTRVLFLSAATSLDLYQRGIEAGVLLRKPFDVRDLVRLVRTLLAG
jgi:CheY-like chemotaxis protein